MADRHTTFGDELFAALRARSVVEPLIARDPSLTIDDAYLISRRLLERRLGDGERLIGKKIGVTSPAVQNMLGVHQPDFGYLTDVMRFDGEMPISEHLIQPRAEGEIAFVLSEGLVGPGVTAEDALAATATIHPCFEVVDSRIRDWKIGIVDTISDNASSGLFVMGDGIAPEGFDFVGCPMTVFKNGTELSRGQGSAALGSPLNCVAWLANTLGRFGIPLEAGEIILSGSLVPLEPVTAGDHMRVEIGGLGSTEVRFTMIHAAILGPGNIGTDLLFKALRSELVKPVWSVGIVETSEGLSIARDKGVKTTHEGIDALLPRLEADDIRIVFDATSAKVHKMHAAKLEGTGVRIIDLTPAAIGPYCIPPVNLEAHLDAPNVNMVTCGGQATIPMVAAVSRVQPVAYGEIVATVSSRSVGPGTRKNIDEFTRTTRAGIEVVGGAKKGKAIIVVNPADPPIIMRDTIHCLTEDTPDQGAITRSVHDMVAEVQRYVPGYQLKNGPIFDGKRVSVFMEVAGLGDYLPTYAGNLDIMTAAALRTAEMLAERM